MPRRNFFSFFILLIVFFLVPLAGFSQVPEPFHYFSVFFVEVGIVIALATPFLFALALLFFFWGLALFILSAGNEEKRERGKKIMLWGIVALFVMTGIWGIIEILQNVFGTDPNITPSPFPQAPRLE